MRYLKDKLDYIQNSKMNNLRKKLILSVFPICLCGYLGNPWVQQIGPQWSAVIQYLLASQRSAHGEVWPWGPVDANWTIWTRSPGRDNQARRGRGGRSVGEDLPVRRWHTGHRFTHLVISQPVKKTSVPVLYKWRKYYYFLWAANSLNTQAAACVGIWISVWYLGDFPN